MENISTIQTPDFLTPSTQPAQPLFLRAVASADADEITTYHLTFLQQPVDYSLHWLHQPDGSTERRRCTGEGCSWCASGGISQEMYAGLVIDHDAPRFAIVQMSRAASTPVAAALTDYVVGDLDEATPVISAFGLADPRQPLVTLRAMRAERGPRYRATAMARDFATHPTTGKPLSLRAWFTTRKGGDWLAEALGSTAPILRPHVLEPKTLDVMPLIWPQPLDAALPVGDLHV